MKPSLPALTALVLLGFASATPVFAQSAEDVIPAAQLREDLRVMRTALEESHVGLHWFISEQELDRRFRTVADELTQPMTAREFHRRLLPVVASLQHGHTTLTLPTEGVGYRLRHLSKERGYFPFQVKVLEGRLYAVSDLSEEGSVGPGAQIVAIDGRPVSALLDTMRQYLSADGSNETFKMFKLGPGFQFQYLLDLLYGPAEAYTVEVLPISGEAKSPLRVGAVAPEQISALFRERTGRGIDEYPAALGFELISDSVALLTVSSFYEGRAGSGEPSFEEALASAFQQIKDRQIRNLIIDVRGNEGGNDSYVPLLYSYLADDSFQLATPTTLASASMSSLPYAENPSDVIQAFAGAPSNFVSQASDGSWVLKEEFDTDRYRTYDPQPNSFTGRLYVLTDGGSFSATNAFLDLVYRYHRIEEGKSVRFVGEQNGGDNSFGQVSGGQMLTVVLPNSGQKLSIPLLGFSQHFAEVPSGAVIPDHPVSPSILDVITGTDRALLFTRELISR